MEEVWKNVVSADSYYEISTTGLVRNKLTGKILVGGISCQGYPCVYLRKNGTSRRFYLHRLLLIVFVRLPKEGEQGRHLDGNPLNYNLSNLKWGTSSENRKDAIKHGTAYIPNNKLGSKSRNSKLTDEQVLEIHSLTLQGFTLKKIANKFNVSTSTILSIKKKKLIRTSSINPQSLNQSSQLTFV